MLAVFVGYSQKKRQEKDDNNRNKNGTEHKSNWDFVLDSRDTSYQLNNSVLEDDFKMTTFEFEVQAYKRVKVEGFSKDCKDMARTWLIDHLDEECNDILDNAVVQ